MSWVTVIAFNDRVEPCDNRSCIQAIDSYITIFFYLLTIHSALQCEAGYNLLQRLTHMNVEYQLSQFAAASQ